MVEVDNGIGGGTELDINTALVITSFVAIALYNVVELNFIIFATFKKKRGLYFWSFVVATWSIAPYVIGFLIKDLELSNISALYVTILVLGWSGMVTGQSVVLYSRLHLVDRNRTRLRLVLAMIIFNAIICHIPIAVMVYGSNSANPGPFILPYSIYEKVQVTVFFLQELVISGLYIAATIRIFRLDSGLHGKSSGKTLRHLIWVNVIIICLDITILGLEYAGYYDLQTAYKGLVYSVKLKLEFNILNGLIDLTKTSVSLSEHGAGDYVHHSSRSRTNGGSTLVALETIDTKGARRGRSRTDGETIGGAGAGAYNAFATDGKAELRGNGSRTPGGGIMVTTKVDITQHADSEPSHSEPGTDRESLEVGASELRFKSSSSSEIGFAKSPY